MSFRELIYNNIDLPNHTIHLYGDVGEKMYETVLKGLALMPACDEITYTLRTEGGNFYDGLAIYDLIRFSGVKSKIVVIGPCMSAGAIILQAGNERVAMPNAQIMVHYGEDSNASASTAQHNADMLKLMQKIIGERVTVTKRTLNTWFSKDTYFNATQAKKAGLIDRVVNHG